MNSQELIQLIRDNDLHELFCQFGESYENITDCIKEYDKYLDFDKILIDLKLNNVESVNSVYNSDELYNIVYFKDYNIYIKFIGEYDSYGNYDHDFTESNWAKMKEVFPKIIEQTIYE